MDILVITWNYPPRRGGIENLLENLCNGLREKHRVFVVTSFEAAARSAEPDIFCAPLAGLIPFAFYALWRGAVLLARNRQMRVVFGGSALATSLVLILAWLFRRRAIVLAHGLDVIYQNSVYQALCVRWLRFCDRVIVNSIYTSTLVEAKRVPPDRVSIIPPGVDFARFSTTTNITETKQTWGIDGRKIILFVGRLARRKGVKEFIENSFVSIVREIPEAIFLVAGDNPAESLTQSGDIAAEINAVISKLGLEKHARLLGSVSDGELIKLYQACDIVVLPALETKDDVEGFGIVALEAAAAGKPVVATRVGGIPDAVEDQKTGILVDPGNYKSLSDVVIALLGNSESRLSLGRCGRSRASQEFSWRRVIGCYEEMFSVAIRRSN